MKEQKVLIKGLSKFVDERNIKKVRLIFEQFHPSDVYEEIKDWPTERVVLLLRLLKEEEASDLFSEMNSEQQEEIINALTSEEIAEIFDEMYADEAVEILEELPANITRKILKVTDSETRQKINSILRYDKNQVGYHMVVDYIAVPSGITVKQAKDHIAKQINNEDLEIVGNVYVYDKDNGQYIGHIAPGTIIANDNATKIDELIEKTSPVVTSAIMADAEETISKYGMPAVPVVNTNDKLVGVIEAEDIIEWFEDASDAAFEAAAVKITDKKYFDITVWESFKSRIPWIVALFIVGTLTQIVLLLFQDWWTMEGMFNESTSAVVSISVMAIATALSLSSSITGSAGNTGSQTSATLVRALALGEVQKGQYMKALSKELTVAFWIGLTIALTAFVRIFVVWFAFGELYSFSGEGWVTGEWASYLALISAITSISFLLTIVLGNVVGASLPLIGARYGLDGAIFSGPVQATVVDVLTILIYFTLMTVVFIALDVEAGDIQQWSHPAASGVMPSTTALNYTII